MFKVTVMKSRSNRTSNSSLLLMGFILIVLIALTVFTYSKIVRQRTKLKSTLDPKLLAVEKEIEESGNIPWSYLQSNGTKMTPAQEKELNLVPRCSTRPLLVDLRFSNLYWQMVTIKKQGSNSTDIYGYSAHIDTRGRSTVIRILVDSFDYLMLKTIEKPKFCQIWYSGAVDPYISKVKSIEYLWFTQDKIKPGVNYFPFLITCELPQTSLQIIPESVSLVQKKCELATNNLRINYIVPPKKEDFGVCVRWLDFPVEDISVELTEWIEMIFILGAAKVHFKIFAVHPNVLKVLQYYEEKGKVTFKQYAFPGYQPNLPQLRSNYIYSLPNRGTKMWRQEIIPYTDCFYTYMHSYNHIALLDIDEIILPISTQNWATLLKDLKISKKITPCFKMIVFTDNLINDPKLNTSTLTQPSQNGETPYMMSQLNTSSVCSSKEKSKCFFSTSNVLVVYNHYPSKCLSYPCSVSVNESMGYVHHHRKFCDLQRFKYDRNTIHKSFRHDSTILKYKDELTSRRNDVVKEVNF